MDSSSDREHVVEVKLLMCLQTLISGIRESVSNMVVTIVIVSYIRSIFDCPK